MVIIHKIYFNRIGFVKCSPNKKEKLIEKWDWKEKWKTKWLLWLHNSGWNEWTNRLVAQFSWHICVKSLKCKNFNIQMNTVWEELRTGYYKNEHFLTAKFALSISCDANIHVWWFSSEMNSVQFFLFFCLFFQFTLFTWTEI